MFHFWNLSRENVTMAFIFEPMYYYSINYTQCKNWWECSFLRLCVFNSSNDRLHDKCVLLVRVQHPSTIRFMCYLSLKLFSHPESYMNDTTFCIWFSSDQINWKTPVGLKSQEECQWIVLAIYEIHVFCDVERLYEMCTNSGWLEECMAVMSQRE